MILQTSEEVTWIRVEKPVFDLAGVIVSALGLAGLASLLALVLGVLFGALLIRRSLRQQHGFPGADRRLVLGLDPRPPR